MESNKRSVTFMDLILFSDPSVRIYLPFSIIRSEVMLLLMVVAMAFKRPSVKAMIKLLG